MLLFIGIFGDNDLYAVIGLSVMIVIVSVGVFLIVFALCKMGALERILQEGDYSKTNKKSNKVIDAITRKEDK